MTSTEPPTPDVYLVAARAYYGHWKDPDPLPAFITERAEHQPFRAAVDATLDHDRRRLSKTLLLMRDLLRGRHGDGIHPHQDGRQYGLEEAASMVLSGPPTARSDLGTEFVAQIDAAGELPDWEREFLEREAASHRAVLLVESAAEILDDFTGRASMEWFARRAAWLEEHERFAATPVVVQDADDGGETATVTFGEPGREWFSVRVVEVPDMPEDMAIVASLPPVRPFETPGEYFRRVIAEGHATVARNVAPLTATTTEDGGQE